MVAKEKAKEIYNRMVEWVTDAHIYKERNIICITAKQSSLICVDEILKIQCLPNEEIDYYIKVKEEINKL
jgi:hypothetical protein